jgi:hypothetical protein
MGLPRSTGASRMVVLWERSSTAARSQKKRSAWVKFDDDKPLAKQEAMMRR